MKMKKKKKKKTTEKEDFTYACQMGREEDYIRKIKFKDYPHLSYCHCSKSIAKFYLLELEYSQRKQNGNFWNGQHEKFYLKELIDETMTILRFVMSAGIGEARHGYRMAFDEYCPIHSIERKLARKFTKQIFTQIGWDFIPSDRNSAYYTYVPEEVFWRMFKLMHDFYSLNWQHAYGGEAWRVGIELAMKTYKAVCLGDFPKICIWLDTLINHCHNGGVLLNKFNCNYYVIKILLDRKQQGDLNYLQKAIHGGDNGIGFSGFKCDTCKRKVPLAPCE